MKIYMNEQLLQYQLFSISNVILHYGLAGMTASHQQFQLPCYLKTKISNETPKT